LAEILTHLKSLQGSVRSYGELTITTYKHTAFAGKSVSNMLLRNSVSNMLLRNILFSRGPQPVVSQGLSIKASWPHSDSPQLVGLLWTSDRSDRETSTWQNTTLTNGRQPYTGGIRNHSPSNLFNSYFISCVIFLVNFRLTYFCDCFIGQLDTAVGHPWSPSLSLQTAGRSLPSLPRT